MTWASGVNSDQSDDKSMHVGYLRNTSKQLDRQANSALIHTILVIIEDDSINSVQLWLNPQGQNKLI